ncbi:thiamine phosphate synthase [Deferribacter autotrophicus]|uniref:Thiamine phosphate synthase n=1 Tax=Deferribacter autotrophicus TaxID=500465 RepID=A0A5A8F4J7_9BACT|nr:thiamine phosphate synthase [Deferribacter autotrophicus]KAA0259064.1 thiamine phosphate synthase [Deferribacter autotrophicus]
MKILQVLDYNTFLNDYIAVAKSVNNYVDFIWFRIKENDLNFVYEKTLQLIKFIDREKLIISEHVDIANILSLRGVHLNKNSIPPEVIKNKFPYLTIGYSAHSLEEISRIDADYYTLSPIFFTKKDYPITPIGHSVHIPSGKKVYALGGINSENVSLLKDNGFYGIAGISFYKELEKLKDILKG